MCDLRWALILHLLMIWMFTCVTVDAGGGVTWRDTISLVAPHPVRSRILLVHRGEPAAIIAVPDDPAYRDIARRISARIREIAGVNLPTIPASRLVTRPALTFSREVHEGKRDIILLGDLTSNPAVARLYINWDAWEDASYPGADGYSVRTLVSPTGESWNAVILGGPGPEEVRAAAEAWMPHIEARGGDVFAAYQFEVEFGTGPFLDEVLRRLEAARAWPKAWRSLLITPQDDAYQTSYGDRDPTQWVFATLDRFLVYGGLYYGLTGDPAFAHMVGDAIDVLYENLDWVEAHRVADYDAHYSIEIWLRAWQQVANTPNLTLRQRERGYAVMAFLAAQMWIYRSMGTSTPYRILSRHQYSGVFAGDALCRYIQRQCDLRGELASEIAQNRAAFRPIIDDMLTTYTTGFDHKWGLDGNWHLLQYAAEEPVPDYITSGLARLNADFATMCINNAGKFVNFGAENIGATEGYDAWQILGRAAILTNDGRYQWWIDNRMRSHPYKVFIMSISWLGHWYQSALRPQRPEHMVGINRILLPTPLYEDLRAGKGRLYAGTPVVNDVALSDSFNKITFRDGLDPADQYLMLDGLGGVTYSGNDANAICEYSRYETPLIVQYSLKHEPFYQNTCSVSRGNAGDPVGTFAELLQMADLGPLAYTSSRVSPMQGADHVRHVFFEKEGWVAIIDDLTLHDTDEYVLACTFRGFGEAELDNDAGRWTLRNGAADLHLQRIILPGISPLPTMVANERTVAITRAGQEVVVQVLRETAAGKMGAGQTYRFANVFTGVRGGEKWDLDAVGLSPDVIAVRGRRTVIYGVPRTNQMSVGGLSIGAAACRFSDNSAEFIALTQLEADGKYLMNPRAPVTIELEFATATARVMSPSSRCVDTIRWEPEWTREVSFVELTRGIALPDRTRLALDVYRVREAVQQALRAARTASQAEPPPAVAAPPWPGAQCLIPPSSPVSASVHVDITGDDEADLIMARHDGHLVALSSRGDLIFDVSLSNKALLAVWAGELQGRPTVLCGSRDGMVYACDANGEVLWTYRNQHWGYGSRPSVYSLAVGDFRGDGSKLVALGCHGGVTLIEPDDEPLFVRFTEVYAHDIVPMSTVQLPGETHEWVMLNSRGGGLKLVDPTAGVVVNGWRQMWGGRAWYQRMHRIGNALWFVHAGFNGVGASRLDRVKWQTGQRGEVWEDGSWYQRTDGETRAALVDDFDGDGTPEILTANETGFLVCYALDGRRLWWELVGVSLNDLALADLAPGDGSELVIAGRQPGITIMNRGRRRLMRWTPDNGAGVVRLWANGRELLAITSDGQVWRLPALSS